MFVAFVVAEVVNGAAEAQYPMCFSGIPAKHFSPAECDEFVVFAPLVGLETEAVAVAVAVAGDVSASADSEVAFGSDAQASIADW